MNALATYRPEEPFYTLWDGFCSLGEDRDEVTVTKSLVTVHFNERSGATPTTPRWLSLTATVMEQRD